MRGREVGLGPRSSARSSADARRGTLVSRAPSDFRDLRPGVGASALDQSVQRFSAPTMGGPRVGKQCETRSVAHRRRRRHVRASAPRVAAHRDRRAARRRRAASTARVDAKRIVITAVTARARRAPRSAVAASLARVASRARIVAPSPRALFAASIAGRSSRARGRDDDDARRKRTREISPRGARRSRTGGATRARHRSRTTRRCRSNSTGRSAD